MWGSASASHKVRPTELTKPAELQTKTAECNKVTLMALLCLKFPLDIKVKLKFIWNLSVSKALLFYLYINEACMALNFSLKPHLLRLSLYTQKHPHLREI